MSHLPYVESRHKIGDTLTTAQAEQLPTFSTVTGATCGPRTKHADGMWRYENGGNLVDMTGRLADGEYTVVAIGEAEPIILTAAQANALPVGSVVQDLGGSRFERFEKGWGFIESGYQWSGGKIGLDGHTLIRRGPASSPAVAPIHFDAAAVDAALCATWPNWRADYGGNIAAAIDETVKYLARIEKAHDRRLNKFSEVRAILGAADSESTFDAAARVVRELSEVRADRQVAQGNYHTVREEADRIHALVADLTQELSEARAERDAALARAEQAEQLLTLRHASWQAFPPITLETLAARVAKLEATQ
jgi:hypothetical protein